jgi:hypothetical protein
MADCTTIDGSKKGHPSQKKGVTSGLELVFHSPGGSAAAYGTNIKSKK